MTSIKIEDFIEDRALPKVTSSLKEKLIFALHHREQIIPSVPQL
jgi:hypothetical protein